MQRFALVCLVLLLLPAWALPAPAQAPSAQGATLARAAEHLSDGPLLDPQAALDLLAPLPGPEARLLALTALRLLGRSQEAVSGANQLLLAGRPLPEIFLERGLALAALGSHQRALEDFETALRLDPGHWDTLVAQGDLFFALELPDKAEASYTRAIEAAPNRALAWINRGVTRDEQGRLQEALADYDRALALAPASATAHANRGVARSQAGDLPGMCADYRRACVLGACRRLDDAQAMGFCLPDQP